MCVTSPSCTNILITGKWRWARWKTHFPISVFMTWHKNIRVCSVSYSTFLSVRFHVDYWKFVLFCSKLFLTTSSCRSFHMSGQKNADFFYSGIKRSNSNEGSRESCTSHYFYDYGAVWCRQGKCRFYEVLLCFFFFVNVTPTKHNRTHGFIHLNTCILIRLKSLFFVSVVVLCEHGCICTFAALLWKVL